MTKKGDTWMPLYIGDYLADTSRLTTEQHGAYFLLLMDYWRNGPPLDDDQELATISKLSLPAWKKHAPKLRAFFRSEDGRLIQKRSDEERARAGLVSSKRAESGRQGAAKRWGKTDGKSIANAMARPSENGWQNDAPSPSPSPSPVQAIEVLPTVAGAGEDDPDLSGHSPTPAGAICRQLRAAGVVRANPLHPRLLALIEAGATAAEFLAFAPKAIAEADDAFAYLLGAVEGERKRAARTAGQVHRGPLKAANRQEAIEAENWRVANEWLSQQESTNAG